jgi:hypothetical protein
MDNQSHFQPAPILPRPQPPTPPSSYQPPAGLPRQRRSGATPLLIILVILLAVAVVGVYLWQHQKVTKLQTQLTPSASAASLTSGQYLYMYDYGIKLPLTNGIKDLYYVSARSNSIDGDVLDFSSETLSNADMQCTAEPAGNAAFRYVPITPATSTNETDVNGSPLGLVSITAKPLPSNEVGSLDQDVGVLMSHVNGEYIYFKGPQSPCSGNGTTEAQTMQQIKLLETSLKQAKPING